MQFGGLVMRRIKVFFLCLTAIAMLADMALAGPSSNRIKDGPGLMDTLFGDQDGDQPGSVVQRKKVPASLAQSSIYDGVWIDQQGRILLLKQIHHTLFLSGNNDHAAWQAQCIIRVHSLRCIGSGLSHTVGAFTYESDFKMHDAGLQSNWTVQGHSDKRKSGYAQYKKAL